MAWRPTTPRGKDERARSASKGKPVPALAMPGERRGGGTSAGAGVGVGAGASPQSPASARSPARRDELRARSLSDPKRLMPFVPTPHPPPFSLFAGEAIVRDGGTLYFSFVGPSAHRFDVRAHYCAPGFLWITNYRLVFHSLRGTLTTSIALAAVADVEALKSGASGAAGQLELVRLVCRDMRIVGFGFHGAALDLKRDLLIALASHMAKEDPTQRFCFLSKEHYSPAHLYEPACELDRYGLASKRVAALCAANRDYSLCAVYPRTLLLAHTTAKHLSDERLYALALHREERRIPMLSWGQFTPNAPAYRSMLWRCSRPLLSGKHAAFGRTVERDLELMEGLWYAANAEAETDEEDVAVQVVDTGREDSHIAAAYAQYASTRFLGLSSREVAAKYEQLFDYVTAQSHRLVDTEHALALGVWKQLVARYLQVARDLAEGLKSGRVCMVLQSGGRDYGTDALLATLLQVLLDPHCRTVRGFATLIEKEWTSHGVHCKNAHWTGVYFLCLNCVWLLLRLHGHVFEFHEELLVFLLDAPINARFHSLLFRSEREAERAHTDTSGASAFGYIITHSDDFVNRFYTPLAAPLPRTPGGGADGALWHAYLLRHSPAYQERHAELLVALDESDRSPTLMLTAQLVDREALAAIAQRWSDLRTLELVQCGLREVHAELGALTGLTALSLGSNEITIVSPLVPLALTRLQTLSLRSNSLAALPRSLWRLPELRELVLRDNQFRMLPRAISQLAATLEVIDLSGNAIFTLPSTFSALTRLTSLALARNQCVTLPTHCLHGLASLVSLDVAHNGLARMPAMHDLTALTVLDVSYNALEALPNELGHCVHLRRLVATNNQLRTLPESIGACTELEYLDVQLNRLESLPHSLGHCASLQLLCAGRNSLASLPGTVHLLQRLETLDLSSNHFMEVPALVCTLRSLLLLDLRGNEITELPPALSQLRETLVAVHVDESAMVSPPPGVLSQGMSAVLAYLHALHAHPVPNHRAKLLVVGDANIGKSTLIRALGGEWGADEPLPAPPPGANLSTDGVDIARYHFALRTVDEERKRKKKPVALGEVSVSVWDFAGQDVYYATHQLFLTSHAVYLLVFDLRVETWDRALDYWLDSLRARVKQARVLLVGTHLDDRIFTENASLAEQRLTAIRARVSRFSRYFAALEVFAVSATTRAGLALLRPAVEASICALPHLQVPVPRALVQLEEALRGLAVTRASLPVLREAELHALGQALGLDRDGLRMCVRLLHEAGSVVYFDDERTLRDTLILSPQWLTRALATLFTTKHRWLRHGVLTEAVLAQVWNGYPAHLHAQLLRLLDAFDIAHELPPVDGERQWIIPALLDTIQPLSLGDQWPASSSDPIYVGRVHRASFLPAGLCARLQVRLLRAFVPAAPLIWRDGLVFRVPDEQAVVYVASEATDSALLLLQLRATGSGGLDVWREMLHAWAEAILPWRQLAWHAYAIHPAHTGARWTIEKLQDALLGGQSRMLPDEGDGAALAVEALAPDLAVADYDGPRLDLGELKLGPGGDAEQVVRGSLASVWHSTLDAREVAVKRFHADTERARAWAEWQREISMARRVRHPNCAALLGICTRRALCVVLEWLPLGDLYNLLHSEIRLEWPLLIKVALDVARGIEHLHTGRQPPMAHLDVKSPNVLLVSLDHRATVVAKIVDYGSARLVRAPLRRCDVDSPLWQAPELAARDPFDQRVDTYAYGVILWELVARDKVFGHVRWLADVAALVLAGQRPQLPPWTPPAYAALVRACWAQAADDRPNWSAVIGQLTLMKRRGDALEAEWGTLMHDGLAERHTERHREAIRLEEERVRLQAAATQLTIQTARIAAKSEEKRPKSARGKKDRASVSEVGVDWRSDGSIDDTSSGGGKRSKDRRLSTQEKRALQMQRGLSLSEIMKRRKKLVKSESESSPSSLHRSTESTSDGLRLRGLESMIAACTDGTFSARTERAALLASYREAGHTAEAVMDSVLRRLQTCAQAEVRAACAALLQQWIHEHASDFSRDRQSLHTQLSAFRSSVLGVEVFEQRIVDAVDALLAHLEAQYPELLATAAAKRSGKGSSKDSRAGALDIKTSSAPDMSIRKDSSPHNSKQCESPRERRSDRPHVRRRSRTVSVLEAGADGAASSPRRRKEERREQRRSDKGA